MTNLKQKPKLVVMAGFPGSGKTRIARYLSRKLSTPRLSADELREMLFDKRYPPEIARDLNLSARYATTREEEDWMWGTVSGLKMLYVRRELGAIIDFSAPYNKGRQWVFNTETEQGEELEADKYLFVVQVDEKVLREEREHPNAVDRWKQVWEEPDNKGYQTVNLTNNTKWDYRRALRTAFKTLTGESNPRKWRISGAA